MDEAARVGVGQGLGDLDDDLQGPLLGDGPAGCLEEVEDGRAVDELLDEVGVVLGLAGVDGLDDVVVREFGGGPALLDEPAAGLGVARGLREEDLDGHDPVDRDLPALVHHRLAAAAHLLQQLDAGNLDGGRDGLFLEGGDDAAGLVLRQRAHLDQGIGHGQGALLDLGLVEEPAGGLQFLIGHQAAVQDVLLEPRFDPAQSALIRFGRPRFR